MAIKVLPAAFAEDPALRARFEQEARAIAALSHPHICAIHDIGREGDVHYLVLEYLEGQTLAARLSAGALPLDQALPLAVQIAEALAAAHKAGIVHRDLKPANVFLTKTGPKLLDFGLAKIAAPPATAGVNVSALPTTPPDLTVQGTILGTFQYMAPEQLEGQEADARADVLAFGCVLYEMLTGRRAFEGKSQASLIAAIIGTTPTAVATLQPRIPASLERIVTTCLAKDRDDRWQSARDMARELALATTSAPQPTTVTQPANASSKSSRAILAAAAALLVGVVIGVAGSLALLSREPVASEARLQIVTPPGADSTGFALSPDGRKLVYAAGEQLWLRAMASETGRAIAPLSSSAAYPFWSPDGQSIGFFSDASLKRLDIDSGAVRTLAPAPLGRGGSWNTDGTILFSPSTSAPIYRVSAQGGATTAVTKIEGSQQTDHRFPVFLPDGNHFMYFVYGTTNVQGIYVASLQDTGSEKLLDAESAAVFLPPNQVLFSRQGALLAQPLTSAMELDGEPVAVATSVLTPPGTFGRVALSASAGIIAYRAKPEERSLAWFDRTGRQLSSVGEPDANEPADVQLSPDGRILALNRTVDGNTDVWLLDLVRGGLRRLNEAGRDQSATWAPDGRLIAFDSDQTGNADLYVRNADGTGSARLILSSPEIKNPHDWSADGRILLYSSMSATGARDLWALPMTGDDPKPIAVAQSNFNEAQPRFSPDSQWVAYQSNETGRNEIYAQRFPSGSSRVQLSTMGGTAPAWRRDGREIYFVGPDNRLMVVGLRPTVGSLEPSVPTALFVLPAQVGYDVSPDGQRFLVNTVTKDVSPITVVLNWRPPS